MKTSEELGFLAQILQPQGIKVVTTGGDEIGDFLSARYGTRDPEEVCALWRSTLEQLPHAKVVLLGVPMDIGAGFERGAFKGPLGVRSQFLKATGLYERLEALGVIDIGDVRVNPSLISDEYLSAKVKRAVRTSRGQDPAKASIPVSPLSILGAALKRIARVCPSAKVHLVGGDHSLTMVSTLLLARHKTNSSRSLGIVHLDAHTDLLRERDGLNCSFATWAHHANEAIGRGGRLQQLGTRISGKTGAEWQRECGVRQFWSDEIASRGDEDILTELCANLRAAGVSRVYVSNDVDGTDPRWVAATGTMVQGGMLPEFVSGVITRLGESFDVLGADVTELAPPLKWHIPGEPARSNQTAAHYTLVQIEALLQRPGVLAGFIPIPAPATEEEVWTLPRYA